MYEQIGYSVADIVAKAVFGRADLVLSREVWCVRMTKLSVLLCLRSCSSCEDKPFVTGDRFVAGFAHQVTSDADAEVEAFNAYAGWCKDQAQDDGHQQETLDASIASTNAAIVNFTA